MDVLPAFEAHDAALEAPQYLQRLAIVARVAAAEVEGDHRRGVEKQAARRLQRNAVQGAARVFEGTVTIAGEVVGGRAQ